MRNAPMLISFVAALVTMQMATAQVTELIIYPLGSANTASTQGVLLGSTIVFSCTIPGLAFYPGLFGYTELHAMVGGVDTVICSVAPSRCTYDGGGSLMATKTLTCVIVNDSVCATGSQAPPFASRVITPSISFSVNLTYTMTLASVSDSGGYYCKISAGNILFSSISNTATMLQVYYPASQPTLSFAGGKNVFLVGQAYPEIVCSANVGAPYGWLQLTASGPIGPWNTPPYPNYFSVTNSTVLNPNGTYTMTYTFAFPLPTYLLSSNSNDTFVCLACNSYTCGYESQPGIASTPLTIQFQYPVSDITVSLPLGSALSEYFVQSNTSYTLTVSQGMVVTLDCAAQGNPSPSFQWSQLSGQNAVTVLSAQVSSTLSIVETLTLQCTASNTISASSPSPPYNTSQTATVNIVVVATTTTVETTTLTNATFMNISLAKNNGVGVRHHHNWTMMVLVVLVVLGVASRYQSM